MNLVIVLVGSAWLYWLLRPIVATRTNKERIAYTTTTIPYDSMMACTNAKEEWNFAVGAYQMSKRPTRIITAVCNDSSTGTVQ